MAKMKRVSVLQDLIDAGEADPISDEEREIAASIRAQYEKRIGTARFNERVQELERLGYSRDERC